MLSGIVPAGSRVAFGTPAGERPKGIPKIKVIVKNVKKSKSELTGPIVTINLLMKLISHRFGLSMYSSSTYPL